MLLNKWPSWFLTELNNSGMRLITTDFKGYMILIYENDPLQLNYSESFLFYISTETEHMKK